MWWKTVKHRKTTWHIRVQITFSFYCSYLLWHFRKCWWILKVFIHSTFTRVQTLISLSNSNASLTTVLVIIYVEIYDNCLYSSILCQFFKLVGPLIHVFDKLQLIEIVGSSWIQPIKHSTQFTNTVKIHSEKTILSNKNFFHSLLY